MGDGTRTRILPDDPETRPPPAKGRRPRQRGSGDSPVADLKVYVSNFSRIPIRLVKGMNFGTIKPISPTQMGDEDERGLYTLLADEGILPEE